MHSKLSTENIVGEEVGSKMEAMKSVVFLSFFGRCPLKNPKNYCGVSRLSRPMEDGLGSGDLGLNFKHTYS